uniref:Uncharacterized protein n=1 Tax=Anguilla anguilla TaxID=7936 RepID=A0A0E9U6V1_ANGAN
MISILYGEGSMCGVRGAGFPPTKDTFRNRSSQSWTRRAKGF